MTQEQFRAEFFREGEKVTVDANELQKLINEKKLLEAKVKTLTYKLDLATALAYERPKEVKLYA